MGTSRSLCLDESKGCDATGRKTRNGWFYTSGQTGQAVTRSYTRTVTYRWSDGHMCTPGVDCDQGPRLYVKSGGNSGPLVYIGRQYSTHPYWSYFRKNNPRGWSPITRYFIYDSDGNKVPGKMGGNLIFNKIGAPYREATHVETLETLNPGATRDFFLAARKNGENDYTSFGYWMNERFFLRSSGGYAARTAHMKIGIFAGGTNPATDVSGVAGTATYRGEAAGGVSWRTDEPATRWSTYDGAPVTITADFDAMKMDTTINLANRIHEPSGCVAAAGCLQQWRDVGPEKIRFIDSRINANGTFGGFYVVHADPEFRTLPDNPGQLHTIRNPNGSENYLEGRFYVPDGDNAPEQALGTFGVSAGEISGNSSPRFYEVYGAFGTVKQ